MSDKSSTKDLKNRIKDMDKQRVNLQEQMRICSGIIAVNNATLNNNRTIENIVESRRASNPEITDVDVIMDITEISQHFYSQLELIDATLTRIESELGEAREELSGKVAKTRTHKAKQMLQNARNKMLSVTELATIDPEISARAAKALQKAERELSIVRTEIEFLQGQNLQSQVDSASINLAEKHSAMVEISRQLEAIKDSQPEQAAALAQELEQAIEDFDTASQEYNAAKFTLTRLEFSLKTREKSLVKNIFALRNFPKVVDLAEKQEIQDEIISKVKEHPRVEHLRKEIAKLSTKEKDKLKGEFGSQFEFLKNIESTKRHYEGKLDKVRRKASEAKAEAKKVFRKETFSKENIKVAGRKAAAAGKRTAKAVKKALSKANLKQAGGSIVLALEYADLAGGYLDISSEALEITSTAAKGLGAIGKVRAAGKMASELKDGGEDTAKNFTKKLGTATSQVAKFLHAKMTSYATKLATDASSLLISFEEKDWPMVAAQLGAIGYDVSKLVALAGGGVPTAVTIPLMALAKSDKLLQLYIKLQASEAIKKGSRAFLYEDDGNGGFIIYDIIKQKKIATRKGDKIEDRRHQKYFEDISKQDQDLCELLIQQHEEVRRKEAGYKSQQGVTNADQEYEPPLIVDTDENTGEITVVRREDAISMAEIADLEKLERALEDLKVSKDPTLRNKGGTLTQAGRKEEQRLRDKILAKSPETRMAYQTHQKKKSKDSKKLKGKISNKGKKVVKGKGR